MLFNLNYIDPTAFSIGPLSIKWYGIIIAVGILIGYFIAQESLKYVGLHKDTLVDVIFYSAIFGFITARIYFVIFQWPYYAQNPIEIPMIWHGGIAIHGGLLGGFITGIIVCKIKNLNPFQIGDIVAPSIILAQGIGRWGNFMNHEAHGGPVSRTFLENLHIPEFIIRNMYIEGIYYHPTFLYESIWDILGFIILITIRKHLRVGETFTLYLIWYSIGRFFVEGLRTDSLMLTSHIRVAQLVSIILIIIGLVILIYRRIKYQPPLYKEAGSLTWNSSKAKVKS
ncbi:prolipoprotein diacylglyceryl transferase [Staphylococcus haemolyticus]|uniref:prolipoprotein diacylglyceryl transferase n=1 Tax=Staphylococcus haemolyticus TaxID=1283 RepID=UPI000D1E8AC1|nr:prolipoprotein diacylglyceryl transferase [Staphylococcus haemolyticus]PTK75715.1 prolipoprotein diacylglyceryl transferase [Staphylococcus haemolyticus]PTK81310.1 prolipoprotein diacylglyceryl transferase [Staphylococcus haemolyticus]PTK98135.1 prolipoprotein diacylglyceryl transferase [Staphylococcus haemolyticus]RIO68885.1 prolipoprotein diacylglyceryl transferase [Staphylococcus haemolyticus]